MIESKCPTCGEALPPSGLCANCDTQVRAETSSPFAGAEPEIQGYRILRHLGEGGMGSVYLAEDQSLGRRVAIKVVSKRLSDDVQSRTRFNREARTLATIEHPHVVRVYSFGTAGDMAYLVMEYVEGDTLTQRIAREARLPVAEALRVTRQVAQALEAAWEHRVIHRDIKPSNVLIDRRGEVRVADFGLAKPMHLHRADDSSLTQSGYMLGTPHYVSPEQAQGREVDFRTDIYSLGIMLYHMIAGERPFDGSTPIAVVAKHLNAPIPRMTGRVPGVTEEIDHLIAWMAAKETPARPASYTELIAAIDALRTPTPTKPARTFSTVSIAKRDPQLIAIAATLLLALAGVLVWSARRPARPHPAAVIGASDSRLVVAVAPFYGPDDDSAKEGRVMGALIEQAIVKRLGAPKARVLGIDETKTAVRDATAARALGLKLGANVVIWGEAFALRKETEIQPQITVIRRDEPPAGNEKSAPGIVRPMQGDEVLFDRGGSPVKLLAEAPNQIELRKTSASGIGDLVVLVAGMHALDQHDAAAALDFLRQSPATPERLRLEANALIDLGRAGEARATLERAIAADPNNAASHALVGDLQVSAGNYPAAAASYAAAAALHQPFTTTRGFVDGGRLYVDEDLRGKYYTSGEYTPTLYLIAIDPPTGRVLERHLLPGLPVQYVPDADGTKIVVDAGKGVNVDVHFSRRQLDRPFWPPPDLLRRVRSSKTGRVIASNFLQHDLDGVRSSDRKFDPRFALPPRREDIDTAYPTTLEDLERALRAAADRDPTQPWYPFLLALKLRQDGRNAEAEQLFSHVVDGQWPVPYWDFSWMAGITERIRASGWSDRLAARALAQRALVPSPPLFDILIDRLINANFVRHAALNNEGLHGYEMLRQARALTGISIEAEDIAAAAWARWFAASGDRDRARIERDLANRSIRSPLNRLTAARHTDLALTAMSGAIITHLLVIVATVAMAIARWIHAGGLRLSTSPLANARHRSLIIACVAIGVVVVIVYDYVSSVAGSWSAVPVSAVALAALAYLLFGRSLAMLFASVAPRERRAVIASVALVAITCSAAFLEGGRLLAAGALPLGLSDSLGHPKMVDEIRQEFDRDRDNVGLRYVLAVLTHYSGDRSAAQALYEGVATDAAAKNLAALKAGRYPPVPLSEDDWARAFTTLRRRNRAIWESEDRVATAWRYAGATALGLGIASVLFLFLCRSGSRPPARRDGSAMRIGSLLIPGLWDMRRGSVMRAMIIVFGLSSVVLLASAMSTRQVGAFGPVSLSAMPNFGATFPLPPANENLQTLMRRAAFIDPVTTGSLAVIAALAITALVLHVSRFGVILRGGSGAQEDPQQSTVVVA